MGLTPQNITLSAIKSAIQDLYSAARHIHTINFNNNLKATVSDVSKLFVYQTEKRKVYPNCVFVAIDLNTNVATNFSMIGISTLCVVNFAQPWIEIRNGTLYVGDLYPKTQNTESMVYNINIVVRRRLSDG